MQASTEHLIVSTKVKQELKRRKVILSKGVGKKVSFDMVLRNILGWS
jgi:hypothetical protein